MTRYFHGYYFVNIISKRDTLASILKQNNDAPLVFTHVTHINYTYTRCNHGKDVQIAVITLAPLSPPPLRTLNVLQKFMFKGIIEIQFMSSKIETQLFTRN